MKARRFIRLLVWVAIVAAMQPVTARGGTVQTADGRVIQGAITFANGRIHIQPPIGPAEQIDPADLLLLTTDTDPTIAQPRDALPLPWTSTDIGKVGLNGQATHQNGTFHISGAGADIWETEDSFQFVHQPAGGRIELTARVLSMQNTHPHAKAGVMVRDVLNPTSRFVMFLVKPTGELALEYRSSGNAELVKREKVDLPVWLRLQRDGNRWQALHSADGKSWIPFAELDAAMTPGHAGLAVLSHDTSRLCIARFDHVDLKSSGSSGARRSVVDRVMVPAGIELRDGRRIVGQVGAMSREAVRIKLAGAQEEVTIPLPQVARVMFEPMTWEMTHNLLDGRNGVLMKTGDFLEGEVSILSQRNARVSSILYGLRMVAREQAAMLVLNQSDPADAPVVLQMADGSIWKTDRLRIEGDRMVVEDDIAGVMRLESRHFQTIRAMKDRTASLLAIEPSISQRNGVIGRAMAIGRSVTGYPLSLRNQPIETGLSSAGNAELNFTLDRPYRALICTSGVAAEMSPLLRGELVILGDGRELYRSPPMTAADPARQIGVPLKGVRTLTLVIQPSGDHPIAPAAIWADPRLVIE